MANAVKRSWTALVVTTRTAKEADAVANELATYQEKGFIAQETVLLTIADPWSNTGSGVGSGGATINALLYTVEHLCARKGHQVLSPDVLSDADILIIHHGRPYPFGCSSRAFSLLPLEDFLAKEFMELQTNLLNIFNFVSEQLLLQFEHGLWVCSSDMLMKYDPKSIATLAPPASGKQDACIITVSATATYASRHGVVVSDQEGLVKDILYARPEAVLSEHALVDGSVALVSGIVYLSVAVSEQLLVLVSSPDLESCTYVSHDVGSEPHSVSLFFDMLLAMCSQMTEGDFMVRSTFISRCDVQATGEADRESARRVRRLIWDKMRRFILTSVHLPNVKHLYLSMDLCASDHLAALEEFHDSKLIHSVFVNPSVKEGLCDVRGINTCISGWDLLPEKVTLLNCYLTPALTLEANVLVCNVDLRKEYFDSGGLTLKSGLVLQTFPVNLVTPNPKVVRIPVVFGFSDFLMGTSGYCNVPWADFFQTNEINQTDLWPASSEKKNIWNAKLFPVLTDFGEATLDLLFWAFRKPQPSSKKPKELASWRSSWRFSLNDIFRSLEVSVEFADRRSLFYDVLSEVIIQKLTAAEDFYFLPYFRSASFDGFAEKLLRILDGVASTASPGVAARTLALTADLLGCMAKGHGGLRSGPAANEAFAAAFKAFENENMENGVALMAKERSKWTARPDLLIRCARHYEGAAQICIRRAVSSAKQYISVHPKEAATLSGRKGDVWFVAECPARIDLSGGWTDTPPIAYEKGGLVVNAALLINGKRPIGAKVRKTERLSIALVGDNGFRLELLETSDLQDFCIPNAPGALLKTCILFARIVELQDGQSLTDQLRRKWQCGFEIQSWSNLPQGSGLGTSSILAAGIIAALWSATDMNFNRESVVHAVLCIEQMLTTGGGWQDQVGGIYGGIKAGSSAAKLPLEVQTESLMVDAENIEQLNSRIMLIYTGKPRLAKNLLQNVVRNWYAREESVVSTCTKLKTNAQRCQEAFQKWHFATICACITAYYEQKKLMAAGTEPISVKEMIESLQPYICAHTLAGAGGGGFFFCLLKDPTERGFVENLLTSLKGAEGSVIFSAAIDVDGMRLSTIPLV